VVGRIKFLMEEREMLKTCKKCNKEKNVTEFFKDSRGYSGGYMAVCKACKTEKLYKWRIKNADKWRKYVKEYCQRPKAKRRIKKYQDSERSKEMARVRERSNKTRTMRKNYLLNNPEKARAFNARRNYKKRSILSKLTKLNDKIREVLKEKMGDLCFYCGEKSPKTLDHLLPLSKGGDNDDENLVLCCRSCNSQKKNKTALEYMNWCAK